MRRVSLLAAVCVVALAACGGGDGNAAKGPSVSVETLRVAAQNSQAATSTSFDMTMSMTVDGEHMTMRGHGFAAADGRTLQMVIDFESVGSVEARFVDGTFYYDFSSVPGAAAELPDGKTWLAFDLDDLAAAGGVDLDELMDQAEQSTANQSLEYLTGLSGDVENVGEETINGVPATHYRGTVDYGTVADQLPDGTDERARKVMRELGVVPADLWVDGQDRVVQVRLEIPGGAFGADVGTAEMTMQITGFDVPVNVDAPPADQVADIDDLITEEFHDVGEPLSSI